MAINEQYIDNIAQEQLLSDEEERQLADRIKVGDARALEQLTKANLRFVVSLAHHYRGARTGRGRPRERGQYRPDARRGPV